MDEYLQFALVTMASVLFIVDPIAVVPTYLVITQGQTPSQRHVTARRACIAAAVLLAVFALAGRKIFGLFGITLRVGENLMLRIGQTGIRVMTRIMGLLLAAIVVQFIITGVKEALVQ